eukprot:9672177-Lingulodinium_polyedra.AAC.1
MMLSRRRLRRVGRSRIHRGCSVSKHNAVRSAKKPQACSKSGSVRARWAWSAGLPRAGCPLPCTAGAAFQTLAHSCKVASAASCAASGAWPCTASGVHLAG